MKEKWEGFSSINVPIFTHQLVCPNRTGRNYLLRKFYVIVSQTALNWLFIYPKGIYDLMLYVRDKYKNPPVYITENGNT